MAATAEGSKLFFEFTSFVSSPVVNLAGAKRSGSSLNFVLIKEGPWSKGNGANWRSAINSKFSVFMVFRLIQNSEFIIDFGLSRQTLTAISRSESAVSGSRRAIPPPLRPKSAPYHP